MLHPLRKYCCWLKKNYYKIILICHADVGFCVGFGCIGKVTLPKQRKNHVRLLVGLIIFRSKTRVVLPGIKSKVAVFDALASDILYVPYSFTRVDTGKHPERHCSNWDNSWVQQISATVLKCISDLLSRSIAFHNLALII